MFNLFRRKCPVSTFEKAWSEIAYLSIRDALGSELLLESALIVPQGDLTLPQPCDEAIVRAMLSMICENMRVDITDFTIDAASDAATANVTVPSRITYVAGEMIDPRLVLPHLATRVSQKKLHDCDLQVADPSLRAWITRLLPNYCGFGLVAANATGVDAQLSHGGWGEITSRVHAYSLALFAWYRRENNPEWAQNLRPDAAEPFEKSLNYLVRTNDSSFHPDTRDNSRYRAVQSITEDLRKGNPTAKSVALWQVSGRPDVKSFQAEIERCLNDRDPWVRTQTLLTLSQCELVSESARERIELALSDPVVEVRCGALDACQRHLTPGPEVIATIAALLNDREPKTSYKAIRILKEYGKTSDCVLPDILRTLKRAIVDCDWELAESLADAIQEIAEHPTADVTEFFSNDEELKGHALELFEQVAKPK